MYKLTGYIDLAPNRPTFLIPVFTKSDTNTPYVQSMDEFCRIDDFFPYYDYERFDFIRESIRSIEADKGQGGVIAFRSHDGEIICGGTDSVFAFAELHKDSLADAPLLKMQLDRMTVEPLAEQYKDWQMVADACFATDSQKRSWIEGELHLYQSNEKIWKLINSKNKPKPPNQIPLLGVADPEVEDLIAVLSNPQYYDYVGWDLLWFGLKSKVPRDERVYFIANDWLYATLWSMTDISRARTVLIETLKYWRHLYVYRSFAPELSEFIAEIIQDGTFFSDQLRMPFSSLREALYIVSRYRQAGLYLPTVLHALADNYFSYSDTVTLLSELEEPSTGPEYIAEMAAGHEQLLQRVADRIAIFEGEEFVDDFHRTWGPFINKVGAGNG
jgi:hypothetical protein